jgi:RNA 3'-terminal phosphate cyclase (ATP)
MSKGSTLKGAVKDSQEVEFLPGEITPGTYTADTGTAGSITLLLQIALPCLLFIPPNPQQTQTQTVESILTLRGGTNAIQAPQIDYTENIFLLFIRQHFGIEAKVDAKLRGYFPKGGGEVKATIQARDTPLPAVTLLERGEVTSITGRVYVAGLPPKLAKDCRDAAVASLVKQGIDRAIIDIPYLREPQGSHIGAGSGLVLWATTENGCIIGGSAVGEKKKDAIELGREAAEELGRNLAHGGCIDEYLQDQWIIFGALAEGKSRVRCGLPLTLHTR